jgi:LysM repeat protein
MQNLRQLGGGVIIALISVLLVIGGISLALAETLPSQATPTPIPPTVALDFPTATFTLASLLSETTTSTTTATLTPIVSVTDTLFPTNTLLVQASCTPPGGWLRIFTASGDTIYSLAQRYKTTAENLSAANCLSSFDIPVGFALYVPPVPTVTVIPCGPPVSYTGRHVVQAGDNLYRIALSYGITYPQLQRANCMGSSTTIYAGQVLRVPYIVATRTPVPGVTIVPDSPTAIYTPTTVIPTATSVPPSATFTTIPTTPPTFTPSNAPPTPSQ